MSRSGHIGHETMCGVEMEKDFHSQRESHELLRASKIRYRCLFEAAHEAAISHMVAGGQTLFTVIWRHLSLYLAQRAPRSLAGFLKGLAL